VGAFHTYALKRTLSVGREAEADIPVLTARGLPDSPVVRQLFEWIAELEKRPTKSDPA